MSAKKIYAMYLGIDNLDKAVRWLRIADLELAKNFVWDDTNPDYIIASDKIYAIPEYAQKFLELANNNPDSIRIFFTGEALLPDFNIFDYAVTPNYKFVFMDRSARWIYKLNTYGFSGDTDLIFNTPFNETNDLTFDAAKSLIRSKKRFCNFMYSHNLGHPYRDKLFHAVSEYKRVDSLGSHLNNVNTLITVNDGGEVYKAGWTSASVEIKKHYKFSIACENARYYGYTTEKLLTSFAAHTVPIYWGNPVVAQEYNPEAFINCNEYSSFDEIIKRIREIDENDDLWAYMVSQPWQTEEQQRASEQERRSYEEFMTNIFTQPLDKAKRRPEGTYVDGDYTSFFQMGLPKRKTLSERIMGLIMHPGRIIDRIQRRLSRFYGSKLKSTDINDFFKDD